jgi:hypothetical protein
VSTTRRWAASSSTASATAAEREEAHQLAFAFEEHDPQEDVVPGLAPPGQQTLEGAGSEAPGGAGAPQAGYTPARGQGQQLVMGFVAVSSSLLVLLLLCMVCVSAVRQQAPTASTNHVETKFQRFL